MRLDVSNNRISSVPRNTFTGCKLLEFLALEGNEIKSDIDGLEEIKASLRVLYLASSSQVAANNSSSYLQENNKTNPLCSNLPSYVSSIMEKLPKLVLLDGQSTSLWVASGGEKYEEENQEFENGTARGITPDKEYTVVLPTESWITNMKKEESKEDQLKAKYGGGVGKENRSIVDCAEVGKSKKMLDSMIKEVDGDVKDSRERMKDQITNLLAPGSSLMSTPSLMTVPS